MTMSSRFMRQLPSVGRLGPVWSSDRAAYGGARPDLEVATHQVVVRRCELVNEPSTTERASLEELVVAR